MNTVPDDLRQYAGEEQDIVSHDQSNQTLILLGRSGVGKTSIINVIKDPLHCPPVSLLHVATQQPCSHHIGTLQIIDTPDIFDDNQQPSRCQIMNDRFIIDHFQIPFINNVVPLFALVFSLQQGISSDDITAILNFQSKFAQLRRKMLLILTHCEEKLPRQRHALIDEFFEHSRLVKSDVRDFFERGVLFMGCLRRESLENNDRTALMFEYRHVMEMRNEFLRRCLERDSFTIISLDYSPVNLYCSYIRQLCNIVSKRSWKCLLCLCPIISLVIFLYFRYRAANIETIVTPKIPEDPVLLEPSSPPKTINTSSLIYFRKGLWYGKTNENF